MCSRLWRSREGFKLASVLMTTFYFLLQMNCFNLQEESCFLVVVVVVDMHCRATRHRQAYSTWQFWLEWAQTLWGSSILRLYYCNVMGDRTLAYQAFQAFLPQDYATVARGGGFGWCMTLNPSRTSAFSLGYFQRLSISLPVCFSLCLSSFATVCLSFSPVVDCLSCFISF